MTKSILFKTVNKLSPLLLKHDTQYKNGIIIEIKVSCIIYKLVHGDNFFVCSELFVIGKSIMSWLIGAKMQVVMHDFKRFCCLPNIQGAINGTHIAILKTLTLILRIIFILRQRVIQ
jgi:hypothetical protein